MVKTTKSTVKHRNKRSLRGRHRRMSGGAPQYCISKRKYGQKRNTKFLIAVCQIYQKKWRWKEKRYKEPAGRSRDTCQKDLVPWTKPSCRWWWCHIEDAVRAAKKLAVSTQQLLINSIKHSSSVSLAKTVMNMDKQEECTWNIRVQETREFTPGKPPLKKIKLRGKLRGAGSRT